MLGVGTAHHICIQNGYYASENAFCTPLQLTEQWYKLWSGIVNWMKSESRVVQQSNLIDDGVRSERAVIQSFIRKQASCTRSTDVRSEELHYNRFSWQTSNRAYCLTQETWIGIGKIFKLTSNSSTQVWQIVVLSPAITFGLESSELLAWRINCRNLFLFALFVFSR